jgi:hypothetical protein
MLCMLVLKVNSIATDYLYLSSGKAGLLLQVSKFTARLYRLNLWSSFLRSFASKHELVISIPDLFLSGSLCVLP